MIDLLILAGVAYIIFKDRPTRQAAGKQISVWKRKLFA